MTTKTKTGTINIALNRVNIVSPNRIPVINGKNRFVGLLNHLKMAQVVNVNKRAVKISVAVMWIFTPPSFEYRIIEVHCVITDSKDANSAVE